MSLTQALQTMVVLLRPPACSFYGLMPYLHSTKKLILFQLIVMHRAKSFEHFTFSIQFNFETATLLISFFYLLGFRIKLLTAVAFPTQSLLSC